MIRARTGVHCCAVLLEHRQYLGLVEDVIRLGILDVLLRPAVELVAGQPVADRHREAQLLSVEHVLRNDALHRLTQRVLRRPLGDLHVDREGLRDVENDLVQERDAQLQGVGHRDLVRLDQDVPAQPGEQIQVLHASHRIHVLRLCVDRGGHLTVIPLRAHLAQHAFQLLVVEGAGVAVVALLHGHCAALQQRLTAHALRQRVAQFRQHLINRARNLLERGEAQRLLINRVATEELIRALAGEHDLHVLAGLGCHEVQRNQRWVGDRVVQVPHDLGHRVGELFWADHLDDVLRADRRSGLRSDVHLGVTLALKTGGEGQQVRVVALGQRCDGRGVDAAGEEGTHRDVRAHVLGHGILQGLGDALEEGILAARRDLSHRELRLEVTLLLDGAAALCALRWGSDERAGAGFQTEDVLVQALRLRHVLQIRVVSNSPGIQIEVQADGVRKGKDALLLGGEYRRLVCRGQVHRLDAERIASEEQAALHRIPDRDAEHATQVVDHIGTPVVEANDDRLAVATGIKGVAQPLELLAELDVVVDLAVEGHGVAVRLIRRAPLQRLVGVLQVDDGQAVEAEDHIVVVPGAAVVRATVTHARQRFSDRVGERVGSAVGGQ